jgi:hypothetical protein
VEWLKQTLIIFISLLSPPCRWPHDWPKHVGDRYAIKLHPQHQSAFVGLLTYFMGLINAQNMEYFKIYLVLAVHTISHNFIPITNSGLELRPYRRQYWKEYFLWNILRLIYIPIPSKEKNKSFVEYFEVNFVFPNAVGG